MGIKLDWEVESEGGWDEVGEDPRVIEARRRQARRMRNGLLAALAIVLAVGGMVAYRLFRVGQEVREALKATVAAETLALRIGDREAYLEAQSTLGGWRQIQERTFRQYQAEGPRIEVSGQIAKMDISADQARVTLREVVDGQAYHVMWFYQRNDGGWKHIAPAPRFWGEQLEHRSDSFKFDYYSEDQSLVDVLVDQLDGWWETACDLTQCTDRPASLDVKIEVDPLAEVGWAQYDANTLIIPSPLLGRFPDDGTPDPALTSRLADLIADRWAEHLIGKAIPAYSEADWLRSEVHHWLRQSFDLTQPPAPLLTPLVQSYGQQIVPPLIERIKQREPVVPVLQDLTGAHVADLPVGWELYLTYRLWAEASLLGEGKETEAMLLYRDPGMPPGAGADVTSSLRQSDVDTSRVIGLRRYGDLLWAETVLGGIAPQFAGTPDETLTLFLPFRLLDDRWVRTVAAEADWGPVREDVGTYVTVRYYDLDALTVAGLQTTLEEIYTQVDADLGGLAEVQVLVEIAAYNPQGYVIGPGPGEVQANSPEVLSLQIASPHNSWHYWLTGTIQESTRSVATQDMITGLVRHALGSPSPDHPVLVALQFRELSRFGWVSDDEFSPASWCNSSENPDACQPPESLEDLWSPGTSDDMRDNFAASVLLGMLTKRYGEEVIARLATNFSRAGSMDDWLYRSLGIHAADIESEWIEQVSVELNGMP